MERNKRGEKRAATAAEQEADDSCKKPKVPALARFAHFSVLQFLSHNRNY